MGSDQSEVMLKVNVVNALLLEGEPENISVDDHGGTIYTGYKPQYIIDAMNQAFGIGIWGFEEISSEVIPSEKGGLAIAQVKVWIEGVTAHPVGWGQNRVTRGDFGDARKGAQTDAIKKALSYFSIGNRAYRGLLPNPKQQSTQNVSKSVPIQSPTQSRQNGTSKIVPPIPINGKSDTQTDYLRPSEVEKIKTEWVAVRGIQPNKVAELWIAFKAYIADGPAMADDRITRVHEKRMRDYLTSKKQNKAS